MPRTAVIIGAGPAGLTAAWELGQRTDIRPIVLELGDWIGGISRTVVHGGNRIDIGGHRFFSKSDRVMAWWLDKLPMQRVDGDQVRIAYQNNARDLAAGDGPDPEQDDRVMLVRQRRSRIYYLRRFFDYPVRLSPDTMRKLGLRRTARIGLSYGRATLRPRPEHSLEDFMINRFGRELYRTFFREYTEKVWGRPCHEISAEWGAQRIKGLSLLKAAEHFFKRLVPGSPVDVAQKGTETSLIEQFLYPKYGPGQMWETVAEQVRRAGGEVRNRWKVIEVRADPRARRVAGVVALDPDGRRVNLDADVVFSTMPVKELVRAMEPTAAPPDDVRQVAEGLLYRDFVTVGLLADRLEIFDRVDGRKVPVRDNWIYIQEPGVKVGRMQVFNNWSPWMVGDRDRTWVGLEYFCDEGDEMWCLDDAAMMRLGIDETARMGIVDPRAVRDQVVIRVPKTYPAYFGTYDRFDVLRRWVDGFDNLFLVGRNGMHRYNNQDHSMLTAMVAVDQLEAGRIDKAAIWAVNTEQEYHEERSG